LQTDRAKIEKAGVRIVGISYDSVDVLRKFSTGRKIAFPLLSDPDSKVIRAYSLFNKEMAGKKFGTIKLEGVPYPGTVIVGKDGTIKAKLFHDGVATRHSTDDLIKAARKLKE
jgi:peroxiredoxin Q/BCP